MSQFPTIESFFRPLSTNEPKSEGNITPTKVGDGFTEADVQSVLNPTTKAWKPQEVYDEVQIGELSPGPRRSNITGRVVNFFEVATPSKMPTAATGYLKLIVKDDTGTLLVSL